MNKRNKIIIGLGVLIAIVVLLLILMPSTESTFTDEAQLLSSTGVATVGDSTVLQSEALFLTQIQQLKQINLSKASLLQGQQFRQLEDNTVDLREVKAGRPNPFDAIDARVVIEGNNNQDTNQSAPVITAPESEPEPVEDNSLDS